MNVSGDATNGNNSCQCGKIHKFTCKNHPLLHVGGKNSGGNPFADVLTSKKNKATK